MAEKINSLIYILTCSCSESWSRFYYESLSNNRTLEQMSKRIKEEYWKFVNKIRLRVVYGKNLESQLECWFSIAGTVSLLFIVVCKNLWKIYSKEIHKRVDAVKARRSYVFERIHYRKRRQMFEEENLNLYTLVVSFIRYLHILNKN